MTNQLLLSLQHILNKTCDYGIFNLKQFNVKFDNWLDHIRYLEHININLFTCDSYSRLLTNINKTNLKLTLVINMCTLDITFNTA